MTGMISFEGFDIQIPIPAQDKISYIIDDGALSIFFRIQKLLNLSRESIQPFCRSLNASQKLNYFYKLFVRNGIF